MQTEVYYKVIIIIIIITIYLWTWSTVDELFEFLKPVEEILRPCEAFWFSPVYERCVEGFAIPGERH